MAHEDKTTPDPLAHMPLVATLGLVFGALVVSGTTLVLTSLGALRAETGGYIPPETIWAMIGGTVLGLIGLGLFFGLVLYLRKKPRHTRVC